MLNLTINSTSSRDTENNFSHTLIKNWPRSQQKFSSSMTSTPTKLLALSRCWVKDRLRLLSMSPRLIQTSPFQHPKTGLDSILTMMDLSALMTCSRACFLSTSSSKTTTWSKPPNKSRTNFIKMLSLICSKSLKWTRSLETRPLKTNNRTNLSSNNKLRCNDSRT